MIDDLFVGKPYDVHVVRYVARYWQYMLLGIILVALAFVYGPTCGFHFVNLDDPSLVYENPFVTSFSLSRIAHSFATYDPELYIPLTFVSYQIEVALFGLQPWHFHVINLLLHAGCVVLLFLSIRRLFSPSIALMTAALFALHPINTETVAWVSARKDLLSAFFSLASLWTFLIVRQQHRSVWYVATVMLFFAALLSKASAITLPIIFVLIDTYQHRPISKKMAAEYAPFAALALLFGVIALIGKSANMSHAALSPFGWLLLSAQATIFSLFHILWPANLSPFYPVRGVPSILQLRFFLPIAFVLLAAVYAAKSRSRMIAFGIFFVSLLPSFFTFAKDDHLYLTSDRYVYLPSIIIFLLIAIGLSHYSYTKKYKTALSALFVILLVACGVVSAQQSRLWRDSIALNTAVLALSPDEYHAMNNLGFALEAEGETSRALALYRRAVEINPQFERAYLNAGSLLVTQNNYADAISIFSQGIAQNPHSIALRENLGLAQEKAGLSDEAIATYESLLTIHPRDVLALQDLASLYGKKKEFAKALEAYKRLMEIDSTFKARVLEKVQVQGMTQ